MNTDLIIFQNINPVKYPSSFIGLLDMKLFNGVNDFALRWLWLDTLAVFFARYFEYILIFCLLLFLLKNKRYWLIIIQGFLATILSRLLITNFIRWLWYRPRPFVENHINPVRSLNEISNGVNLLLEKTNAASFPSGHAAFYFALSTVVYFYNKKAGILFFLASFLIAISRVFCGIHWPSDILAGALVGIFSGWLITLLFRKLSLTEKKELPQ